MSLPALEWRKLPTRTLPISNPFSGSYTLNVIADMLTGSLYHDGATRIPGSGSAWKLDSRTNQHGAPWYSFTAFPPLRTSFSQSLLMTVYDTTSPATVLSAPTGSGEPYYSGSIIYSALIKGAVSSSSPWLSNTGATPLGVGSYTLGNYPAIHRFNVTANHRITIFESKEAIAVYFYHPTANIANAVVAGAIIDPEQSASLDTEPDGRLYAIATSGTSFISGSNTTSAGINTSFITNPDAGHSYYWLTQGHNMAGVLFSHNPNLSIYPAYRDYAISRFVAYQPNVSNAGNYTGYPVTVDVERTPLLATSSFSGKLTNLSMYCAGNTNGYVGNCFLGRLRDISTNYMVSNAILRDASNNIVGYSIGGRENTACQVAILNYS